MSSTADTDDVIEISTDGISVRKSFTANEFPVPAIRFEIESNREEPVTFQLSEDVPSSFPMDRVGFHPDYHSDDWTAFQDNHVEFTATLEPNERLVTVYGIQLQDERRGAEFLSEPTVVERSGDDDIERSDAEELDDDLLGNIVAEDRSQAVKDMISGETESMPGLEEPEPRGLDAEVDLGGGIGSIDETPEDSVGLDLDLSGIDPDPIDVDADDLEDEGDEPPDIDLGFEEEEIPGPETESPAIDTGADNATDRLGVDLDIGGSVDEGTTTDSSGDSGITIDLGLDDSETGVDEDDAPSMETDIGGGAGEGTPADSSDDSGITIDLGHDDSKPSVGGDDAPSVESDLDPKPVGEPDIDTGPVGEPDLKSGQAETTERAERTKEPTSSVKPEVSGSIAARLATEIREESVDEEDLDVIQTALDTELDPEPSGGHIAKIDHLQSRIEEVAAYTDALETFLEENGTGAQLIDELQTEFDSLEADFSSMDDRLEEMNTRVDDVEADIVDLSDWNTDLEADLGAVTDDVDAVEGTVDELADNIEAVDDEVKSVAADLESVESDLDDVRSDVTEIHTWREQLGSMFSE
ncbi:AAA family ATPase [Natrinema gelatinilyticum]|uniref:AAA family ATPase n=1 Tax=Natrinema gelatinilyticum TaxID=2961571 RepID=UPI0020C35F65|nr:AAA family ATPase [Natrinema gelatinilyticum]